MSQQQKQPQQKQQQKKQPQQNKLDKKKIEQYLKSLELKEQEVQLENTAKPLPFCNATGEGLAGSGYEPC